MSDLSFIVNQPIRDFTAKWPIVEPRDKPIEIRPREDDLLTAILLPRSKKRIIDFYARVIQGSERWRQTMAFELDDAKGTQVHIRNTFWPFELEAIGILEALGYAPPNRVTLNYNREANFHRDEIAGPPGVLFSFGPRHAFMAIAEAGMLFYLPEGSALVWRQDFLHGSALEDEDARPSRLPKPPRRWFGQSKTVDPWWHLNLVYWSR